MIKIRPSVLRNKKLTYARESVLPLRFDYSDGINDLLCPTCCTKGTADYPHGEELQLAICRWWQEYAHITPEMLLLGNGSQQLLYLVNKLLIDPGCRVLGYAPQYSSYCSDVLLCGGQYRAAATEENGKFSGATLLEELTDEDTLIYLDNPNNPTGQCLPLDEVAHIARVAAAKGVCVFVDEAFGDYISQEESAICLLGQYDNIIVSRTFSKAFGMAGLRLGYLSATPAVIREMKKLTTPYDGSSPARSMACSALAETDFLSHLRRVVRQVKQPMLEERFSSLRIAYTDPRTPVFLLQHLRPDFDLEAALAQEGLGSVSGRSFYGIGQNSVRLRVPQPKHLEEILQILRRIDTMR